MSATDHWMRFNVGDYLADTMHLSTFQHGIYMRLIMHYFKRRELPEDEKSLARIAGISVPLWRRESGPAASLFTHENGVWKHRRIDAEIARCDAIREVKQSAGKQGANKRWNMAHAKAADSTCDSQTMADSRAGVRARATEPQPQPTTREAPLNPPDGGKRRAGRVNGGGGERKENGRYRNAWNEHGAAIIGEEEVDDRDIRDDKIVSIVGRL
jgi:uncharacterized protein YdaU (DUF1376 family)